MVKKPEEVRSVVVTDPDPTAAVKEALELAIKNLDDKIDRRFQGNDQATVLAREELKDRLAALQTTITDTADARAEANKNLVEKLAEGNKDLVEKLERANQIALAAALQTQNNLLNQLQVSFETANKATNEKIDRLTSRLDTGEGRVGGVDDNRRDYREQRRDNVDYRTYIVALIGVLVAIAVAFFGMGLHK
jgi:hypothetical protein